MSEHMTVAEFIKGGAPTTAWIACQHPERDPFDHGLCIDSDCAKCRIVMQAIVDRWPDAIAREGVHGGPATPTPLAKSLANALQRGRNVS